jgi:hypothetical protein
MAFLYFIDVMGLLGSGGVYDGEKCIGFGYSLFPDHPSIVQLVIFWKTILLTSIYTYNAQFSAPTRRRLMQTNLSFSPAVLL